MSVPVLSLLERKRIRRFVAILLSINPTIIYYYYYRKFFKCNRFQVTTELLKSENLRIAITQQFYYVMANSKVDE